MLFKKIKNIKIIYLLKVDGKITANNGSYVSEFTGCLYNGSTQGLEIISGNGCSEKLIPIELLNK